MLRRKTIVRPSHTAPNLRDPEELERVFDAHSKPLLRMAIHIVGNAAQAEDLVQETFLTVLKHADRYDPSRPIEPWLRGILANQAHRYRRAAARTVDVKAVVERADASPMEDALSADEAGAVAEAIEQLDEPYRQVLLLRIRHGMPAADIAHVLGRSPGTVRVQLHRGIASIRRKLPAAVPLLGLSVGTPTRGLAAVRHVVLTHARTEAALVTGGSSVGGALVAKNLFAWGAAVLALVAVAIWQPWDGSPEDASNHTDNAPAPLEASALDEVAPGLATRHSDDVGASDRPADVAPQAFQGRVVHAETKAPLADAMVAYFAAGETTLREVKRDAWDRTEQQPGGGIGSLVGLPAVFGKLSPGQLLGYSPVAVFRSPGEDEQPLATATTGADGTFQLFTPAVPGVLRVVKTGFGRRSLPAHGGASGVEVDLTPLRVLRGRVLDMEGQPFTQELRIAFSGGTRSPVLAAEAGESGSVSGAGVVATTDESGRFEAWIASRWVHERCRTPGYRLERRDPGNWRKPMRFSLETWLEGEEEQLVTLVAIPTAALVLRDAATKQPIEDFFLHARDQSTGLLSWSGRFFAPSGRFTLLEWDVQRQRAKGTPITLHIWADGYQPETVKVLDLTEAHWIDVELSRGSAPSLGGVVQRDGAGTAGADVALLTFRPIAWSEHDTDYIAWTQSDASGRFDLHAPAGRYVLRVSDRDALYQRVVQVGQDDDLTVDLESETAIDVQVVDTAGNVQVDHAVGINGRDGRSTRAYTDASGFARFVLPPGTYTMFVPHVSTKGSFAADEQQVVALAEGERREITFAVPDASVDVFVHLTCDTPVDFTTWRARQIAPLQEQRVAVRSDGTIPIAVQAGVRQLDVELPDGRRFDLQLPKAPAETLERHIRLIGPRYEGVLLSESGAPRAGVRIIASPSGKDARTATKASCVTDERGRFVLTCSRAVAHSFAFNKDAKRVSWNHLAGGLDGLWYRPKALPSETPTPIEIRLRSRRPAESGKGVRVFGVVRSEDPSRSVGALGMSISLLFRNEHGEMRVNPRGGFVSPDENGRYETVLRRAPLYKAYIYDRGTGKPVAEREWTIDEQTKEIERDFVVPDAD